MSRRKTFNDFALEAMQNPGVDQNDVATPTETEVDPASDINVEGQVGEDTLTTSLALEAIVNYSEDRFSEVVKDIQTDIISSEKFQRSARGPSRTILSEKFVGASAPDVIRLIMMRGAAVNDINHLTKVYSTGLAEIMSVIDQAVSAKGDNTRLPQILSKAADKDLLCNYKLSYDKSSDRFDIDTYTGESALIRIRGIWRLPFWAAYVILGVTIPGASIAFGVGILGTILVRAFSESGIFTNQGAITDKFNIVTEMMDSLTTTSKQYLVKLTNAQQKLSSQPNSEGALSLVMATTKYIDQVMSACVNYQAGLLASKPIRNALDYAKELPKTIDK